MATLAEQIKKYLDIIEDAVGNDNRDLTFCYFDISTATSAGTTDIRIFPKEGKNKFFSNATRDVKANLSFIERIIKEAKSANDRIRIIISREGESHVQLTKYIDCDNEDSKIIDNILDEVEDLALQIKS